MSTSPADDITDLRRRLERAQANLQAMVAVEVGRGEDPERLRGKAQGVGLALSYLDEIVRTARA